MEKISEMIKRMCPEGVEWKKIGDIAYISDYVSAGSFASIRQNVTYLDHPDYAILLRFADYSNGFDVSKFVYVNEHAYIFLKKSNLTPGDIVISNVGSCGQMFRCPDLGTKMTLAPNSIVFRADNNAFYYYWLTTEKGQKDIERITSKSAMPKFNKTQFKEILVPCPPLPIQQEIVRILDSFTSMITNLETELASRQKQYEYYRNKLLTFDKDDESVEWKTLCEITSKIGDGIHGTPIYDKGGEYYFINGNNLEGGNIITKPDTKKVSVDEYNKYRKDMNNRTILISINGTIGKTAKYKNEKCILGKSVCYFNLKNNVNLDYIFHIISSPLFINQISKNAFGSIVKNVSLKQMRELVIPVPSLQRQLEIVSILDTFESLITNLKQEIAARKKQYEYYREQLLTFE